VLKPIENFPEIFTKGSFLDDVMSNPLQILNQCIHRVRATNLDTLRLKTAEMFRVPSSLVTMS